MEEKWVQINGFPSYLISNLGRVKSCNLYNKKSCIILKTTPNKKRKGYVYVNTQERFRRKNWALHRLVAEHFIPKKANKTYVNHIDCDVSNNKVSNLEWVTMQENMNHAVKNGRIKSMRGELCGNHKLKEKTVIAIIKERNKNKTGYKKIAEMFGTNYSNVAHIFRGSRWGHVSHLITNQKTGIARN